MYKLSLEFGSHLVEIRPDHKLLFLRKMKKPQALRSHWQVMTVFRLIIVYILINI